MTDERQSSSTTLMVVVLVLVVLLGLVAFAVCAGVGFYFVRAVPMPPKPQAVPGQPMPQQLPPVLVPREVPPTPNGADLERGDSASKPDQAEPKAEWEDAGQTP
jgi:hypothetical protein